MTQGQTHTHPRVLVIDNPECADALRSKNYNVTEGTFGGIQRTTQAGPLPLRELSAPQYRSEQEVVVVDMTNPPSEKAIEEDPIDGVNYIFQAPSNGLIDPRPLAALCSRADFDRILAHGGLFVVILDAEYSAEYAPSYQDGTRRRQREAEPASNISFLAALECLQLTKISGTEVIINQEMHIDDRAFWGRVLRNAKFNTSIKLNYEFFDKYFEIARNKYGGVVAALMRNTESGAILLLLPELNDAPTTILEIFSSVLAHLQPQLFREHRNSEWINDQKFLPLGIVDLQKKKKDILDKAQASAQKIDDQIEAIQEQDRPLSTLLTGTGDELVKGVIEALRRMGFTQIVDCDAEHTGGDLREDLQVRETQPVLVIDIKGVAGCPDDAECAQAEKHALMRFHESEGKFKPLMIINHERNLHPDLRKASPFRDEIVKNSTAVKGGLMTACELFWLVRNTESLGWEPNHIKPILYRSGVIKGIPEHYTLLGTVCHVWAMAVGVIVESSVSVGGKLAALIDHRFIEFEVASLKVNDTTVSQANKGDECGIAVKAKELGIREGIQLFAVR